MTMTLTEDFKTLEELRREAEAILAQARSTGRPVSITVDGKPAVVLLDVAVFERMLRTLNLVRLVGPAEEAVIAGRTKPLEQVMKEFNLANQISGSGKPRRAAGSSGNPRLHRPRQKGRPRQVGS